MYRKGIIKCSYQKGGFMARVEGSVSRFTLHIQAAKRLINELQKKVTILGTNFGEEGEENNPIRFDTERIDAEFVAECGAYKEGVKALLGQALQELTYCIITDEDLELGLSKNKLYDSPPEPFDIEAAREHLKEMEESGK